MRACLDCGAPCSGPRCAQHQRAAYHRREVDRKARGLTGARGSTRATRKRRERVLDQAQDEHGIPRCFYCARRATVEDHYIPLARGGSEDEDNLKASCAGCNATKGDRDPADFLSSPWLADRRRKAAS